ncbi:hypothetical protein ACFPIF_09900 [Brevundimonas faecalis]
MIVHPARQCGKTARIRIIQATALLQQRREVLADFEAELIEEVRRRVMADPAAIVAVTAAEWRVIDDALDAMRSAPTQALTAAGLAA